MFDPFEYLMLRDSDGLLKRGFQDAARQGELSHSRAIRGCRTSARRRAKCWSGFRHDEVNHGRALRRT